MLESHSTMGKIVEFIILNDPWSHSTEMHPLWQTSDVTSDSLTDVYSCVTWLVRALKYPV